VSGEHERNRRRGKRLGDILVEDGLMERARMEDAARAALTRSRRLGDTLIDLYGVDDRAVWHALADSAGVSFARAEDLLSTIDVAVASSLPRRFAEYEQVVPLHRRGDDVSIATTNLSLNRPAILAALGAARLTLHLVTPTDLRRLRSTVDMRVRAPAVSRVRVARDDDLLKADSALAPELIALVDRLLLEAVGERASDIHIEIYNGAPRVRLRIDGDLHDLRHVHIAPESYAGVINVVKVKADLDIAERRLPQGGRFETSVGKRHFDLRVQTQPSLHGEHAVLRLLPHDQELLSIEDLGFPEDLGIAYRRLLDSPSGLVLVVGPTGSGKSTTLYAGLQVLSKDPTRKVITVEDPIEYAIDNVQQVEARADLGFAFANAMRAFVREDPDVILVGEIRDGETALEAIRASQTGHVVLSTLHSNDSVDAVQRLIDLGMHPNSVAAELLAVFAQRLARRNCPHCKVAAPLDLDLVKEVFPDGVPAGFHAERGLGCPQCHGRGSRGRIAVLEYLPATIELRRAITRRASLDDLREEAHRSGLRPMREQALDLVQQGVIAFESLRELLPVEQLAPSHRRRPSPVLLPDGHG
jgi:type IV pilus assembly protein PilB